MLVVFEVFVAPGTDAEALLSEETRRETGAQVMTVEEAQRVGFAGIASDPKGRQVRLVAVAQRDAQWIHRALEANANVTSYRMHEVQD